MSDRHSATTINVSITLLVAGAAASLLTGAYPGVVLLVVALVLAVAQRSTLARAIRTPDSSRRNRRLRIAAVLSFVFVVSIVSYLRAVSDEDVSGVSLVVHNAIGVPAMIGAIVFLVAGLLTPRTPHNRSHTPVA